MTRTPQRILGIDLQLSALGWAVAEIHDLREVLIAVGLVKEAKESDRRKILASFDDLRRCQRYCLTLREVIEEYNIAAIVAEIPGGSQSASGAKSGGATKGILAAVSTFFPQIQFQGITPTDIKKAVDGKRNASKEDLWAAVSERHPHFKGWPGKKRGGQLLGLNGNLEHPMDAVGCIITAVEHELNIVKAINIDTPALEDVL